MEKPFALHRNIILRTRDFIAKSQSPEGTDFRINCVSECPSEVDEWWEAHRFDNDRHAFAAILHDPVHGEREVLVCHDEIEATAILYGLQRAVNEALV